MAGAAADGGNAEAALAVLQLLEAEGRVGASLPLFHSILRAAVEEDRGDIATAAAARMRALGVRPDAIVLELAVRATRSRDLAAALAGRAPASGNSVEQPPVDSIAEWACLPCGMGGGTPSALEAYALTSLGPDTGARWRYAPPVPSAPSLPEAPFPPSKLMSGELSLAGASEQQQRKQRAAPLRQRTAPAMAGDDEDADSAPVGIAGEEGGGEAEEADEPSVGLRSLLAAAVAAGPGDARRVSLRGPRGFIVRASSVEEALEVATSSASSSATEGEEERLEGGAPAPAPAAEDADALRAGALPMSLEDLLVAASAWVSPNDTSGGASGATGTPSATILRAAKDAGARLLPRHLAAVLAADVECGLRIESSGDGEEGEEEGMEGMEGWGDEDGLEVGEGGALAYDGSKPFAPIGSDARQQQQQQKVQRQEEPVTVTLESSRKSYASRAAERYGI